MNHQTLKEWLTLSLYNELNEQEQMLLNKHLGECSECTEELRKLNHLQTLVNENTNYLNDELLLEARSNLKSALKDEQNKISFFESMIEWLRNLMMNNYKFALTGASMLIVGLVLGYFLSPNKVSNEGSSEFIPASESGRFSGEDIKINNLRFIDSEAGDGEISFTFDAVRSVKMKGNLNDKFIQKVLATSLVNDKNAGVRLRTINTIAENTAEQKPPSNKIKQSLMTALKFDENTGVRREALLVLQKYPMDNETLEAFIYVLNNDKNPGLRIAAINAINPSKLEGKHIDENLINALKQKSNTDENDYIRIRAKSVLEEVVQQ